MATDKRKQEFVKGDKQEIPDSTTRERSFVEGDEVFYVKNDQFILGKIRRVDDSSKKYSYLVAFSDGETIWTSFEDLKAVDILDDSPSCVVCKKRAKIKDSNENNVVVVCETCFRGYHQKCHDPPIRSIENGWNCGKCQKQNCQLPANSLIQKTVSSISKDSSLPPRFDDFIYDSDESKPTVKANENSSKRWCVCGDSGDWHNKMIQCCSCHQWFHENCVHCLLNPLCLGDRFFIFVCSMCNHGTEFVRRLHISWPELLQIVIYNYAESDRSKRTYHYQNGCRFDNLFDLDDILKYSKELWNSLQPPPEISLDEAEREIRRVFENKKLPFIVIKRKERIMCGLRKLDPPSPPPFKLPNARPITDAVLKNAWKDKRWLIFYPLISSNAEAGILNQRSLTVNGSKMARDCRKKKIERKSLLPKGVSPVGRGICIKSASSYNGEVSTIDKQLQKHQLADSRKTQRLKKQTSPTEIKNPIAGDVSLPELPPTPPSSVSAPETPQPSLVNGEAPVSPTEDVTRIDFETSTINLDELIGESKDAHSDVNCFPLLLNQVIVDPLIRPKKRQLSEADYVVVNGERKYKKRRSRKRNSFKNPLTGNVAARLALAYSPVRKIHKSPEDLEKLVHKYFKDEQKVLADEETKRIASNDADEYRIRGKRRTLDGRVEYLVECVKCTWPL